jgi:hypothetical protein
MRALLVVLQGSTLLILVHASCYIHNAKWEKVAKDSSQVTPAGSSKIAQVTPTGSSKIAQVTPTGSSKIAQVTQAGSSKIARVTPIGSSSLYIAPADRSRSYSSR